MRPLRRAILTLLSAAVAAGALPLLPGSPPAATAAADEHDAFAGTGIPFIDGVLRNLSASVERSNEPAVATDLDDTYVAWREDGRIAFTALRDRGTVEDAVTTFDVAPGGLTVAPPGIATVGDDVWVTWSEQIGDPTSFARPYEVFVVHSEDRGRTFSLPEQLSSADGESAYEPRIAATAEVVGVVWDGDDGLELATNERTLGFDLWLREPLGGDTGNGDYDVAATGDTVHVAWAGAGIVSRRAVDGGTRIEPPVQVSPGGRTATQPNIAAVGNDVAIGWVEYNQQNAEGIQMRVGDSGDGGQSFSNTLIGDNGNSCVCGAPIVALAVGRTFAVYDGEAEGIRQAVLEGGAILSVTPVGGSPVIGTPTDVVATSAGVFVSYERTDPATYRPQVHTAARRHGSGDWLLRLAFDRTLAWGSKLAPLGEGDYVVTFIGYDPVSGIEDVYLAPFGYAGQRDLELVSVAAVQGPQDATTLVAGRRTAYRALVRNTTFSAKAITLRWTVASGDLASSTPVVLDQRAFVRPGVHEVWFTPPVGDRPAVGELRAAVEVDPDDEHVEDDDTNNAGESTLPVVETPPFDVLYVPLSSGGVTVPCEAVELVEANSEAYLDATFPIDERESASVPSCASAVDVDGDTPTGARRSLAGVVDDVVDQLDHVADLYDAIVIITPEDWIGESVDGATPGTLGLADYGLRPGIVLVDRAAYSGWAVAHEIGHDQGWYVDATGASGAHLEARPAPGYWVARSLDVELIDFMHPTGSVGGEVTRWISAITWDHLLAELGASPSAGPQRATVDATAAASSITVAGVVADDDAVRGVRLERGAQEPTPAPAAPTGVEAVLLDGGGAELARAALATGESSHAANVGERSFHGRLAEVAGTATVVVEVDGVERFRQARSASAPTVRVLGPTAGTSAEPGSSVAVSWTASDPDGDALTGRVDVSTDDGATWRPARAGIGGTSLDVPVTPELTGAVRYRVTVGDGWDTASAVSETVTVAEGTANGRIAYRAGQSSTQASAPTLRSVGEDGTGDRLVIALQRAGFAREVRDPSWSPDATRLALTEAGGEVLVVGADGSGLRNLGLAARFATARGDNRSTFFCPVWSPDGTHLAFVASGYGLAGAGALGHRLVVVGVDGSDPRVVVDGGLASLSCNGTYNVFGNGGLSWTDDDRIWFRGPAPSDADGPDLIVESVRPDGSERRVEHTVVNGPANDPWAFDVSADGSALVYTDGRNQERDLFVVDLDDGQVRRVTDLPNTTETFPQLGRVEWSPDGRQVAAEVYDDRRPFPRTVEVFDALTGARRRVVGGAGEAEATSPAWGVEPPTEPLPSAPVVTATIADPPAATEGAVVTLDASGSTAEAGPLALAWDLDGDGAFDDATGTSAEATFPDEGTYRVAVEARDGLGQVDVADVEVVVANVDPEVTASTAVERGGVVAVEIDVHDDGVDDELTATVAWGEGPEAPGVAVRGVDGGWQVFATRPAAGAGTSVAVRVEDGDGGSAVAEVDVVAATNTTPTVESTSAETLAGVGVEIDVAAADGDGDPLQLVLVTPPADGEVELLSGGGPGGRPVLRYRPEASARGTRTFEVAATDGFATSAPALVTVAVTGAPEPTTTADAGPDAAGAEGAPVTLAGSAIAEEGHTVRWTFAPGAGVDDGASCAVAAQEPGTTVTCDDDGVWSARLQVVVGDEVLAADESTVTITNAAPGGSVTAPSAIGTGQAFDVTVATTDPGGNDVVTCSIDVGDGAAVPGCALTTTFATAGTRTVTATMTDDDGSATTVSHTVAVSERWTFTGFGSPVKPLPAVNPANAGRTVPVKFGLGADRGGSIFAPGSPTSVAVDCTTRERRGTASPAVGRLVHLTGSADYQLDWQTERRWAGTCRLLVLGLADGSEHTALFRLG